MYLLVAILLLNLSLLIGAIGNFTLSFPRNHEVYISQCGEGTCFIDLYVNGWFNPDSSSFPPALPIQMSILLAHEHFLNITFTELEYNLHLIDFTRRIYIVAEPLLLDFQMTLMDANNNTLFEVKDVHSFTIMILSAERYVHLNHRVDSLSLVVNEPTINHTQSVKWSDEFQKVQSSFLDAQSHHFLGKTIQQFLQRISEEKDNTTKRVKLDYLEIGTSDFNTIIQSVDQFRQQSEQNVCHTKEGENCPLREEYYGISIDAVNGYINRLPSLPTSLKLNAAIIPQNLPATNYEVNMRLNWNPIYFIPDFLLDAYFPQYRFLRGVSEMNRVSPYFTSALNTIKHPVTIIQKEFIPSLSISYLLSWIHRYYSHGINVIKLDIEGLDVQVLNDIIYFYLHYFPNDDNMRLEQLPCLLFFETQTYIKADAENEYELLKKMGYRLLSEHSKMSILLKDVLSTNAIAVNCQCHENLLMDSVKLLVDLNVLNELSSSDLFSNICLTE